MYLINVHMHLINIHINIYVYIIHIYIHIHMGNLPIGPGVCTKKKSKLTNEYGCLDEEYIF